MGLGADSQVHICLGDVPAVSEAGWVSAPLASSGQRCAAPSDLALMGRTRVGTLGPVALGLSIPLPGLHGPPQKSPQVPGLHCFSQNTVFTLHASELLLVLFFFLRLLCPRLRIRETTEKPTPMQTHEGLFTSSSLCPSIPDRAEQGLGPRGGF